MIIQTGMRTDIPAFYSEWFRNRLREGFVLGSDIGAYDSCEHLCRYCYANADPRRVRQNTLAHDPASPFLMGGPMPGDRIHEAK